MNFSINNSHVLRALQLGAEKNVKQLFVAETSNGGLEIKGDLEKRKVVEKLQEMINTEDSLKANWLNNSDPNFPKLPRHLEHLLKQPRLVKNAVTSACNFLMSSSGVKLGHAIFLVWHFPLEKAFMIHTSHLLNKLPNKFTLSHIIEWASLRGTRISNGRISALKVFLQIYCLNNLSGNIIIFIFCSPPVASPIGSLPAKSSWRPCSLCPATMPMSGSRMTAEL